MSKDEIEILLKSAIDKLQKLESCHKEKVQDLEARLMFLEEKCSSQQTMLEDAVSYIKRLEDEVRH